MGTVKLPTDVASLWPHSEGGPCPYVAEGDFFTRYIAVSPRAAQLVTIPYFTKSRMPLTIRCTYFMCQHERKTTLSIT